MAYSTPPTFVAADPLAAADLNILGDDIVDLDARAKQIAFMGVSLLRTSNQSIADSTFTAISWGSSPIDVGNWWTSGDTITVPAAAVPAGYTSIFIALQGMSRSATNGVGTRQIKFQLNGSDIEVEQSYSAINGEATTIAAFVWAEVESGDTIQMMVQQNSGGALNFSYSAAHIHRLGPGN
jgi:hypothetical protein